VIPKGTRGARPLIDRSKLRYPGTAMHSMRDTEYDLRDDFMRMCRVRGPQWVASVIRPLRINNDQITVQDVPVSALRTIIRVFGPLRRP
jgi:hypothetical protein